VFFTVRGKNSIRAAGWCLLALVAGAGPAEAGETPQPLPPAPVVAAEAEQEKKPETVEPLFVRPFTPTGSGRNDGNPLWSRSGMFLSFERSIGDKKEIHIALADGLIFQTLYHVRAAGGE
jgi:hypothetical protein